MGMPRDEAWFEGLYERHRAAITAYCMRRVAAHDAGDLVVQVFAVAWDRRNDVPDGEGVMAPTYAQQHAPVTEQTEAVGHAVRANYLYAGAADVVEAGRILLLFPRERFPRKSHYLRQVTGALGNSFRESPEEIDLKADFWG